MDTFSLFLFMCSLIVATFILPWIVAITFIAAVVALFPVGKEPTWLTRAAYIMYMGTLVVMAIISVSLLVNNL